MSTLQHLPDPEDEAQRPGHDPTQDVIRPAPAAPAVPPRYEPLAGRAAAATAVLGLLLVLDVIAVGSSLLEVGLLDRLAAGETVTDSQLDSNDTRQGVIGIAQFGLFVACAVTFIRWLHRAYKNVDAISPPYRRYDAGWAIGSWFVPILNLFRPVQIVNDVWKSGQPPSARVPFWIGLWWAGWLVSNVLGRIAFGSLDPDATLPELRQDSINYAISDGFDIPVLLLAILVIRVATKRQETRAEAVAAEAPPDRPGSVPPPRPEPPSSP